jgi:2-oxoglutarate dehydrogenase complex dehydrogenase (E1) component-like enzyme
MIDQGGQTIAIIENRRWGGDGSDKAAAKQPEAIAEVTKKRLMPQDSVVTETGTG